MNPKIINDLKDHLAARTGKGGDMAIPPSGVLWTILSPYPAIQQALEKAVKQRGSHIGVIMPQEDRLIKAARGPYADNQPYGGSLRELEMTITVFIRSLKLNVTDGAFLWFGDWLEELLRSFQAAQEDTARIQSVRFMGLEPDYLIVEAQASIRYFSESTSIDWPKLLGIIVSEDFNQDGTQKTMFTLDFST